MSECTRPTALCSVDGLQAPAHEPADVLPEVSRSDGGYECAFGSLLWGRAVRFTEVRLLSLLRHSGLAQPGEVGSFEQLADFGYPQMRDDDLPPGNARITIVRAKSLGFGEFGGGPFSLPSERVGSGEAAAKHRCGGSGPARSLEPRDRLVDARLQQMHSPNQKIRKADRGIAGGSGG